MTADERGLASGLGLTRAAIGVAMVVVPGPSLSGWIGSHQATPGMRLITRALGMREIALGVGTLLAIRHEAPVRGWLEAGALVDASDALTSLLAFRQLPPAARFVVPITGTMAALLGRRLASKLS